MRIVLIPGMYIESTSFKDPMHTYVAVILITHFLYFVAFFSKEWAVVQLQE